MKTYNFYTYKPIRYSTTEMENKIRKFVWEFKDGKVNARNIAAKYVANALSNRVDANDTIFVCIPASNAAKTARRYKKFSEMVCEKTGLQNGYNHVFVYGEKTAIHNVQQGMVREDNLHIVADSKFFYGKNVIIFDDIITKGVASEKFASILERVGAKVLGGLFLARTFKANEMYN